MQPKFGFFWGGGVQNDLSPVTRGFCHDWLKDVNSVFGFQWPGNLQFRLFADRGIQWFDTPRCNTCCCM